MGTAEDIRAKIEAAVADERRSCRLRKRLEPRMVELRVKLLLPQEDPGIALIAFITDYVESVPGCLRLVGAVSKRMGFYDYAAPFLELAQEYFLHPPDDVPENGGLEALLDESFLAHRLLEEVNDHHIRHLQHPLLPVDMTEANIIVHHLLGEEMANGLDRLVHDTAAALLEREHVWDRVKSQPGKTACGTPLLSSNNIAAAPPRVRLRLTS